MAAMARGVVISRAALGSELGGMRSVGGVMRRCVGAVAPTSSGMQSASYFTVPEPSWTSEHVEALVSGGHRGRNRGWMKLGHRLNPYESREVNYAKKHGYLVMKAHCGVSACNKYLHFCYEDNRPYIAISQHGDRVVVDLRPVEGLKGSKSASRMDDMEDLFSDVLDGHWVSDFQIVNEVTEEQAAERLQAAAAEDRDGSNEHKGQDTDITSSFQILTRKRQDAIVMARDLYRAVLDVEPDRKSAKELAEARKQKTVERQWANEKRMRRKLRALVANEKEFQRLPKGALDGFIKYDNEKLPHLKWYPAKWINKPC